MVYHVVCFNHIIEFWYSDQDYFQFFMTLQSFPCQPHKMVKHTQIICRLFPMNCLSVFDHFVGLVLKGLISFVISWNASISNMWYCMRNTSQNSLTGSNDWAWFWKDKKMYGNESFCQKLSFFKWSCMYWL